jgi:hypothetical protein
VINTIKTDFWNTDLKDLEALFLPDGKKITDYPIRLDNRVAPQGSVLLDKVINIDSVIKDVTILQKIKYFFSTKISS